MLMQSARRKSSRGREITECISVVAFMDNFRVSRYIVVKSGSKCIFSAFDETKAKRKRRNSEESRAQSGGAMMCVRERSFLLFRLDGEISGKCCEIADKMLLDSPQLINFLDTDSTHVPKT
jgi:hypothetical protein